MLGGFGVRVPDQLQYGRVDRLREPFFPLPQWQETANVPAKQLFNYTALEFSNFRLFRGRGCPDVAANADFLVAYNFYAEGRWRCGGGTSASAPLIASLIALMVQGVGRRVGFLNPYLYDLQITKGIDVFKPIVQGNNGGYSAAPTKRWNACTGLGAPKGGALLSALQDIFGPP